MENIESITVLKEIAKEYEILFVEDSIALQKQVYKFLSKLFKRVHVASDGVEGLEQFKTQKVDLVLSDLTMPRMNGHEMIREIKKIDPDVEVVILSAHSDTETLMKSFHIGVSDFIAKPVNAPKMIATFLKVLSNMRRREEKIIELNELNNKDDEEILEFLNENSMKIDLINYYRGVPIINGAKIISMDGDEIVLKTAYIQLLVISYENGTILDSSLMSENVECELINIDYDNYEVRLKKGKFFYPPFKNRAQVRVEPDSSFKSFLQIDDRAVEIEIKDLSINAILFRLKKLEKIELKSHDSIKISLSFDKLERLSISKQELEKKSIVVECSVYKVEEDEEDVYKVVAFIKNSHNIQDILQRYVYFREIELIEEFKKEHEYR